MSQAVSYLSWLDSARHEFEALVREKLGAVAAESIDWRNPRMVCIAASFSRHDRVTVQRLHERIDLVRYRIFDGGLLSLLLIESTPGFPRSGSAAPPGAGGGPRRRGQERAVVPGEPDRDSCLPAGPICRA